MTKTESKKIKEEIIRRFNLVDLSASLKKEISSVLMSNLLNMLALGVLEQLSEPEREELAILANKKDEKAVLDYLKLKIDDLPALMEEVLSKTIADFESLRNSQ